MILVAIALAIVVLTILVVHLACVARDEQRSQMRRHPKWIEDRDAKYTYRHGRSYDYQKGVTAKSKAKARMKRRRAQLDQEAIERAAEQRAEVVELAAHRRQA